MSDFVHPVLFVRWKEQCQVGDVTEIRRLTEIAHEQAGDELVYVAIIPVEVKPPDTEARAALREGIDHSSLHCRSVHIVIEGAGMRRALIRSISAGLLLATRKTSHGFHIHVTVQEALATAAAVVALDGPAILTQASVDGILGEGAA